MTGLERAMHGISSGSSARALTGSALEGATMPELRTKFQLYSLIFMTKRLRYASAATLKKYFRVRIDCVEKILSKSPERAGRARGD